MFSLVVFIFFAIAVLLFLMWASPSFKSMVTTSWGWVGATLAAFLAWWLAWFSDAPVLPPS